MTTEAAAPERSTVKVLERKIETSSGSMVSSVWRVPANYDKALGIILAHGAGSDMHDPLLSFIHEMLAQQGVLTVKFNFPYKERGRRAPDRAPVLEATWRAVVGAVRHDTNLVPAELVLGGKSMGGRIASRVVAAGENCGALLFLGYPLHPPRRPEALRTEHLPRIRCPMLFIQGTRDALCNFDLLKRTLKQIFAPVMVHMVEGGDHSFELPKRLGRSRQEVWREIEEVIAAWLASIIAA
ncbi:MAG: alpha/beta family hydrolase [Acidiferrobacterales bacterium]